MSINNSENPSNASSNPNRSLSSTLSSHTFNIRKRSSFGMCVPLFLCACILFLVACGPETPSVDHNVMRDAAKRIAQEYSAGQDLEKARTDLAELDVSNINQWLKYVTEETISQNEDPNSTTMLVRLALDLGVESTTIDRFGIDAGILQAPAPAEILAPAESALEQSSASVIDAFPLEESTSLEESTQRIELIPVNSAEESSEAPAADSAAGAEAADSTASANETSTDGEAVSSESAIVELEASEPEAVAPEVVEPEVVEPEAPADPIAVATSGMNVRSGPGINYGIVGALQIGEQATVVAKNAGGDWWQVNLATGATGWLYAPLTSIEGSTAAVAIAANIPAPPQPTATPLPLPTPTFTYAPPPPPPPTATYYAPPPPTAVPVAAAPPPPPTAVPAAPTAPPAPAPEPEKPVTSGNTFKLIERRLWGVQENGGFLAGDSVNCGDKRELRVRVIDAAGNPINGVTVHGVYTKVDVQTGSQGKGDGVAEYVLGDGEDIKIIRDADGSDVTSDAATGMVTKPHLIDTGSLIQAGYCKDDASCQKNVVEPYACGGHYSWDVKFQRSY